jgi:hypothetical protein
MFKLAVVDVIPVAFEKTISFALLNVNVLLLEPE